MVLIFKLFYLPYIGTFQSHVYKIFQSHIYKILYLLHVYMLIHFSCIGLFGSPWTVVCQAHLSRGFSKQKYWSGLPFPSPGYLPDPGIELCLLYWQVNSLLLHHVGSLKGSGEKQNFSNGFRSLTQCLFCVFFCLRALQGRLPIPKKVNLKKDGKTKTASVTLPGSNELHSAKISHLHFFKSPPFVLHMVQWYW